MKTTRRTLKLALFAVLVAGALSACGKIPESYRGDYADSSAGAQLKLEGGKGAVTLNTGRKIEADANDLQFDSLLEGKPGIYLRATEDNKNEIEVFWLFPRKDTRQQEADFVWVQAEVLYSRMDSKAKDKVQHLKMLHCEDGMLMLDLPTKTWNGGCPAAAEEFDFVRTK